MCPIYGMAPTSFAPYDRSMTPTIRLLVALGLVCAAFSSHAAIRVTPIVSTGLVAPVFAGGANDGSSRIFIAEQRGIIKVLQPGASTPTVFLDNAQRTVSQTARGLFALAFHPNFATNGRFYLWYTRASDEALVLSEFRASTSNRNIADDAETVLLTLSTHPTNNAHNGGMIAFGPDGYLYLSIGDGANGNIGNDPMSNAQNIEVLEGKIIRIDVDRADTVNGNPYSSPSDNPYYGPKAGRDEIFAIGWRNPWRFSFDRAAPHSMWVGDVGQDAREEINAPVVKGGNYGWRIYEGTQCTGLDPSLCNPSRYLSPLFEYTTHVGGRCSVTGGYVYRGARAVLPSGTYVYGDFCSGEILAWNGAQQTVLLGTTLKIVSFGEDDQGELLVVSIAGSVSRIESTVQTADVVEFYNTVLDHYFITADPNEAAAIDNGGAGPGWRRTGNVFKSGGSAAVCRFYGSQTPGPNSHFYTVDPNECASLKQLQATTPSTEKRWNFESLDFASTPATNRSCPAGTVPVYRAYNNGFSRGIDSNHRITANVVAIQEVLARGWVDEGVVMCSPG